MTKQKKGIVSNNVFSEILLYQTPSGKVKVEIYLKDENLWLTQERIAELFGVQRSASSDYKTKFYNLDAIISVGYQVNSKQATQFGIWATERLKDYIIRSS